MVWAADVHLKAPRESIVRWSWMELGFRTWLSWGLEGVGLIYLDPLTVFNICLLLKICLSTKKAEKTPSGGSSKSGGFNEEP